MQNLISIDLGTEDLAAIDAAIATLKERFAAFITLQPENVRGLSKMGDKSEAFCRQALQVLDANPQIVPPSLELDEARADLAALDALRPRLIQLQQLLERAQDTEMALGADLMAAATEGYALLKVSGKDESLKTARKELGARWAKNRRRGAGDPQAPNAQGG